MFQTLLKKTSEPASPQKKWELEGFSCDFWVDPPGQRWENYVHERDEKICLARGKLEVVIDGKTRILHPGKEVHIPAGVSHSVRNIGGTTARWYYGYRRN